MSGKSPRVRALFIVGKEEWMMTYFDVISIGEKWIKANQIEHLVDAFEVKQSTGANYLDDEDFEYLSKCLLEEIIW